MKWLKDAKEGIVVAGGKSSGDALTELSRPQGLVVDLFGEIYVADSDNHRVMHWIKDAKKGTIILVEMMKEIVQIN